MKKNEHEYLSLDLTPLIDVVFILLIFFILSSSFKKDNFVLNLELPDSSSQTKSINKKKISIELNKTHIAFMGEKLTLQELAQKLKTIENKEEYIIVNIDKNVVYTKVINILDLLQKNNLNNISFVTK